VEESFIEGTYTIDDFSRTIPILINSGCCHTGPINIGRLMCEPFNAAVGAGNGGSDGLLDFVGQRGSHFTQRAHAIDMCQIGLKVTSRDLKTAIRRGLALRETINTNLDKVRAFADCVLLEFGPSREQDLALRNHIRQWQPNLRILFILRVVLWRYRVRLPGFELPEAIQPAQAEFDKRLALELDRIADRLKGDEPAQKDCLTRAYAQLEQATWKALPKEQHQLTPKIRSFLLLSRRIATLADCLQREV
jgi:hypothetical protein